MTVIQILCLDKEDIKVTPTNCFVSMKPPYQFNQGSRYVQLLQMSLGCQLQFKVLNESGIIKL